MCTCGATVALVLHASRAPESDPHELVEGYSQLPQRLRLRHGAAASEVLLFWAAWGSVGGLLLRLH